MSGELDAAGAAVTAGLASGVIEGREGARAGEGPCLNCGAALTGPYCSQCGQAAHPHRSLAHMFEEVIHGLFHFDTKAWRTLPMLAFRPGTLTRNYIYGKRARYISPLALFLFTIFFMFFVFAFTDANLFQVNATQDRGEVEAALKEQQEALAEVQADWAEARADRGEGPLSAEAQAQDAGFAASVRELELAVRVLTNELARIDAAAGQSSASTEHEPAAAAAGPGAPPSAEAGPAPQAETPAPPTWQEELREAVRRGDVRVGTPFPALNERILHSLENPDLALYKIQQAAYKFAFLLVPISLPFVWLLFFWKRGLTLYDHTVFVLYSLAFASTIFVTLALTAGVSWLAWLGGTLVGLGVPGHMFFHLKGAYALGWFSALWRTLLLLLSAFLALSIFVLTIVMLGLGG